MCFWLYPVEEVTLPESIQEVLRDEHRLRVAINGRFLDDMEYAVVLPKLAFGIPVALKTSDYVTVHIDTLALCWEYFKGTWQDVSNVVKPLNS